MRSNLLLTGSSAMLVLAACAKQPPQAAVHAYDCGGTTVSASFPDRDTAIVQADGQTFTLRSAVSASGARYTNAAGTVFWTHGAGEALWTPPRGTQVECREKTG